MMMMNATAVYVIVAVFFTALSTVAILAYMREQKTLPTNRQAAFEELAGAGLAGMIMGALWPLLVGLLIICGVAYAVGYAMYCLIHTKGDRR